MPSLHEGFGRTRVAENVVVFKGEGASVLGCDAFLPDDGNNEVLLPKDLVTYTS